MLNNSIALNQNTGALSNGADFKKSPEAIFNKLNNSINVTSKLLDEAEAEKTKYDFEWFFNAVYEEAQNIDEELDTIEDRGIETYKDHYFIRVDFKELKHIWCEKFILNHYLNAKMLTIHSYWQLQKERVKDGIKTGHYIIDSERMDKEEKLDIISIFQKHNRDTNNQSLDRLEREIYSHISFTEDGLVIGDWRADKKYIARLMGEIEDMKGIYDYQNVSRMQRINYELNDFEFTLDTLEWLSEELKMAGRNLKRKIQK